MYCITNVVKWQSFHLIKILYFNNVKYYVDINQRLISSIYANNMSVSISELGVSQFAEQTVSLLTERSETAVSSYANAYILVYPYKTVILVTILILNVIQPSYLLSIVT